MACARCSWRLWILVEALAQVWVLLVGWPQAFMHSPRPHTHWEILASVIPSMLSEASSSKPLSSSRPQSTLHSPKHRINVQ